MMQNDLRKVKEIIIVEGRYDKNTVSQVISGTIIETSGFGFINDKDKIELIKKLAEKRGLIILTDSDRAGFFIRGRLRGMLVDLEVKHAYIPDVIGKEQRKSAPSKEGKLGVEGMHREIIISSLEKAGATFIDNTSERQCGDTITKTDMYNLGLSGKENSSHKRRELLNKLDLPERLSSNSLLDVLNALYTREDFITLVST